VLEGEESTGPPAPGPRAGDGSPLIMPR